MGLTDWSIVSYASKLVFDIMWVSHQIFCWLLLFIFNYPLWLFIHFIFYRWKRFHVLPTDWVRKSRPYCQMCERLHKDHSTHIYDMKDWFVRDSHCLTKNTPRIRSFIGKGYKHSPEVFIIIIAVIIVLISLLLCICHFLYFNELHGTEFTGPLRSSKEMEAMPWDKIPNRYTNFPGLVWWNFYLYNIAFKLDDSKLSLFSKYSKHPIILMWPVNSGNKPHTSKLSHVSAMVICE